MRIPFRSAPTTRKAKPTTTRLRQTTSHVSVRVHKHSQIDSTSLYPYQKTGAEWLRSRDFALNADDMGLGKSAQFLRALDPHDRVILVCPAGLRLNWLAEINGPLSYPRPAQGWRPDLRARIVTNVYEQDYLPRAGEIVIMSYEALPDPISKSALFPDNLRDVTLGGDEIHYTKNPDAKRTKRFRALRSQVRRTWGMTGTPLPSRPLDLYGVLETLGLLKETFGNWKKFSDHFQGKQDIFGNWHFGKKRKGEWRIDPKRLAEARDILAPIMLRRMKKDVLPDLPPKIYTELLVEIEPTPAIVRADKEWLLYGAEEMPPFEMLSEARRHMADAKIPALLETVNRFEETEQSLLVFSAHVAPIHALSRRPGWGVILGETPTKERDRVVKAFQAGELRGLGLTIKAGGVGLTLTAASNCLFVDQEYNPSDNEQAEDRMNRIGQKAKGLNVYTLVADHPLDKRIHQILREKQRVISGVLG